MTSTFLRFQEYYESPEFRGKIFTLEEYMDWYASREGKFTYFDDWAGFNIPSNVLMPFYGGLFDPLMEKEKALLNFFKNMRGDFYVIGTTKGSDDVTLHEIIHGLFFLFPAYRQDVIACIGHFDTNHFSDYLLRDYNEAVLNDEINSFVTEGSDEEIVKYFEKSVLDQLRLKLMNVFNNHFDLWPKDVCLSVCLNILQSRIYRVSWNEIVLLYETRFRYNI